MFPRIIMTDLGRRMKTELEDEHKVHTLYHSPQKKTSPQQNTPYLNPTKDCTKILQTSDDTFYNEVLTSKRKISGLMKLKSKDQKIKYLKQTLMPNLQNIALPKFFEKKLEDSAEMLTHFLPSRSPRKISGNSPMKRSIRNFSQMNEEELFNESLKMVQTFESKILKIYDKYETFKNQEQKIQAEIKAKMEKKLNSNKNRQFIDSRKALASFYNDHKEEIDIMGKVSGEEDRRKDRIMRLHFSKYEEFWKKSSFPESKKNKKEGEYDFMKYRDVMSKRLTTRSKMMKSMNRSNNYDV